MNEKALEALKKGMQTELRGMRFYTQAAEHVQDETGKRVLQTLAEEEKKHLEVLRGQYAALTGGQGWLSLAEAREMAASVEDVGIFPEAEEAGELIPADATDEKTLVLAMDFEWSGYELYKKAAEEAETPQEKAIWEFLAKAENDHFSFIQDTYEYLTTDGVWYFDDQEFPFFEG